MLHRTLKVFATGLLASGLMVSTASASVGGEIVASGCHLGDHPHLESSWAWLVLLLLPLVFRSRLFGRR